MLFGIIKQSFINQKKAMAVMIVSVAAGTAITASLLSLSFDVSAKVSRELRSYGANIVVQPRIGGLVGVSGQKLYLREQDIAKARMIFWRHNILGVAPVLLVHDDMLDATDVLVFDGTMQLRLLPPADWVLLEAVYDPLSYSACSRPAHGSHRHHSLSLFVSGQTSLRC